MKKYLLPMDKNKNPVGSRGSIHQENGSLSGSDSDGKERLKRKRAKTSEKEKRNKERTASKNEGKK